jgi:hypothetical protein
LSVVFIAAFFGAASSRVWMQETARPKPLVQIDRDSATLWS